MKIKKLVLASLALVSVVSLASCKDNSSDAYNTYYTTEMETLNYLTSSMVKDSQFFSDFVDGLLENDRFGNIVPALATTTGSVSINAEGNQEWTFTIRDDASWVDSKGEKVADVVAQDWVDAAQYILTPSNNSGVTSMWFQMILGAQDYYNAKLLVAAAAPDQAALETKYGMTVAEATELAAKSVSEACGVKANGKTLTYTCNGVIPYFNTVLSYNPFFPVNGDFLLETGTSFGDTKDDILYCGGYIMTQHTNQSQTVLQKNKLYWDAEHVYINTINYKYVASTTNTTTRDLYEAGDIDGFNVSSLDTVGYEKYVTGPDGTGTLDKPYSENAYVGSAQGTSTYYAAFNFERAANPNNITTEDTKNMLKYTTHTTASYNNTHKAIQSANFRKMFTYGVDWAQYLSEMYTGGDRTQGLTYNTKTWTVSGLCSAGGKDYTYYVAKEYAEANDLNVDEVYAQFDNAATEDILYNATKAADFARAAKTELAAQGVTFPVKIETWGDITAETQTIREETCAAIEEVLTVDGQKMVEFYVFQPKTPTEENDCFYFGNYDFTFQSGWGPDYADPLTFLNCHTIGGDMFDILGFTDEDSTVAQNILGEYTRLVNVANAISDPSKAVERYEKFAEAEYYLIYDQAIIFPYLHQSVTRVSVTKVLPYTSLRASSGLSAYKHKYMVVASSVIKQAQKDSLQAAFRTGDNAEIDKAIDAIIG